VTVLLEDIAVDIFFVSSFGMFVMGLFHGLLSTRSWQSFALLASGWALASGQHTITAYLWLTGATRVKHFSSFYVFLGGPLYKVRWKLWARLIQCATKWLDIVWACREALYEDGIYPLPWFSPDLTQNCRELAKALTRAA
jgi:hypothetical protein